VFTELRNATVMSGSRSPRGVPGSLPDTPARLAEPGRVPACPGLNSLLLNADACCGRRTGRPHSPRCRARRS
jgi:hypothetical protein